MRNESGHHCKHELPHDMTNRLVYYLESFIYRAKLGYLYTFIRNICNKVQESTIPIRKSTGNLFVNAVISLSGVRATCYSTLYQASSQYSFILFSIMSSFKQSIQSFLCRPLLDNHLLSSFVRPFWLIIKFAANT